MRSRIVLVVLVLLAGCLGKDAAPVPAAPPEETATPRRGDAPPPPRPAVAPAPDAWAFACPNDAAERRDGGACVGRMADARTSYQEPNLAVHPSKPDTWAVGVNAWSLTPGTIDPLARVATLMHVEVLVTTDAGATFRAVTLPSPAPPAADAAAPMSGDPSLAFDGAGTLHATAMLLQQRPSTRFLAADVYYTASRDLGATWSDPVLLSTTQRADRNWLVVGEDGVLYVSWQERSLSSIVVARSFDGGATWPEEGRTVVEGCVTASPVVLREGVPHVACVLSDTGDAGPAALWSVADPAAPTQVAVAPLEGAFPHLALAPDGAWWMAVSAAGGPWIARSADGGATWTATAFAAILDLEAWSDVRALAVDGAGQAHVLVETAPEECPRAACASKSNAEQRILHATIGPDLLARATTVLTPAEAPPPATAGPPGLDDYHSLVFDRDRALLAWSFDRVVEFTELVPSDATDDG